jgi:hypothetical protein
VRVAASTIATTSTIRRVFKMRFDENNVRLVWMTLLGLIVACGLVLLMDRLTSKSSSDIHSTVGFSSGGR